MNADQVRESFEAWYKRNYEDNSHIHKIIAGIGWQAAMQQAIPEGYCVVPKEPTSAMCEVAGDLIVGGLSRSRSPGEIYRAMIAAASEVKE